MIPDDFQKKLEAKGYTTYMAEMICKMVNDLQSRALELSKLTGFDCFLVIE